MAHPLHYDFGSAHIFLLSLVLCSHTRAALRALLEKMGSVPNREGNHTNVRLGRALISGLVDLRCILDMNESGKVYAKGSTTIST